MTKKHCDRCDQVIEKSALESQEVDGFDVKCTFFCSGTHQESK